jgi:hypothetical protein
MNLWFDSGILTSVVGEASFTTIFSNDVVDDVREIDDDTEYEIDVASRCIDIGLLVLMEYLL